MTKKPHDTDVAFIQALAELLRENDLTELEVRRNYGEDDSLKVRVSRAAEVAPPVPQPPVPVASPASAPSPAAIEDPAQHPGVVTSPMVGTAYLQPEPGTAPYVSIGDKVSEGQTLMIIEAMKTMNQIPAPHAGSVKRILIDDGVPVEYGAPLMIIE
ncbi:MAG: acetyl-CoA carboxylase biotin carboxyl carrier protein [Pseudomonadota bacterium]